MASHSAMRASSPPGLRSMRLRSGSGVGLIACPARGVGRGRVWCDWGVVALRSPICFDPRAVQGGGDWAAFTFFRAAFHRSGISPAPSQVCLTWAPRKAPGSRHAVATLNNSHHIATHRERNIRSARTAWFARPLLPLHSALASGWVGAMGNILPNLARQIQ